jgi:hypothetical protein
MDAALSAHSWFAARCVLSAEEHPLFHWLFMIAFQRKGKIILGQVPLKMSISGSPNTGVFRMCSRWCTLLWMPHEHLLQSYQIGHPMQNVAPWEAETLMAWYDAYDFLQLCNTYRDHARHAYSTTWGRPCPYSKPAPRIRQEIQITFFFCLCMSNDSMRKRYLWSW